MPDIKTLLNQFAEAAESWDILRSLRQLVQLEKALGAPIDWDPGAEENWGRILDDGSVHALVSMRGPFIFILDIALESAQKAIYPQFLTVGIASVESEALTADETVLLRVFGSRAAELRASKHLSSVDDLWYTTVT